MTDGPVAGIDIGGTNIDVALVEPGYRVVERLRVRTPDTGPEAVVDAIAEAVGRLPSAPVAVGVGVPGPVHEGMVQTAPNLPGWDRPVPVAAMLQAALDAPAVVDNDANVGTVGEWRAGSGRGARFLLGVWLGTGVGGGLVLDGRPYRGASGGAGEIGHVPIHLGGAQCGCGRRGCVEAYAGRGRMEVTAGTASAAGRATALSGLAAAKGGRMTAGVWAKALKRDDALATSIVDEAVGAVGAGVAGAINLLDLDRVVVGGGLAEKLGQPLVDRVAAAAAPHLLVPDAGRSFALAELGDDAGVVGAAVLALETL